MFSRCPQHDNRSDFAAPSVGRIKWTQDVGSGFGAASAPSIGADGTVYVAGCSPGNVTALDGTTGIKKWVAATGCSAATPAIGANGTIYVGSADNKFFALDGITGTPHWVFSTSGAVYSSAAISPDGIVYFGSEDHSLYAVDGVTGRSRWVFPTGGRVVSSPALAPGVGGAVVFGSGDGSIYSLDARSGALRWKFDTLTSETGGSAVIGEDGTVYYPAGYTYFALDGATGRQRWALPLNQLASPYDGAPAMTANGRSLVVQTSLDGLLVIDLATGVVQQAQQHDQVLGWQSAVIDGAGMVMGASGGGAYSSWDLETGGVNWVHKTASADIPSFGAAIGADGTVYLQGFRGPIWALGE